MVLCTYNSSNFSYTYSVTIVYNYRYQRCTNILVVVKGPIHTQYYC